MIEIFNFIEADNPAAAAKMRSTASRTAAERAANFPHMARPGELAGTRELIPHPSYRIVYEVMDDAIYVHAVIHTSRQWPPVDGRHLNGVRTASPARHARRPRHRRRAGADRRLACRWCSASCASSMSRMASSSCWARCWPGAVASALCRPSRRSAFSRRWSSRRWSSARIALRRRTAGAAAAQLQSGGDHRRHDRHALHHPAGRAQPATAPKRGRSRRPSPTASCCRGSAIPATSCP